jgi:hypothetical protein
VFYSTIVQQPGHLDDTRATLNGRLLGTSLLAPVLVTPVAAALGEFGGGLVVARRRIATR